MTSSDTCPIGLAAGSDRRRQAIRRIVLVTAFPFVASWLFLGGIPQILLASGDHPSARVLTAVAFGGVAGAELLAVALVLRWLRAEGRTLRDLGWRRRSNARAYALAIAAGIAWAVSGLLFSFIRHHGHPDLTEATLFRLWAVLTTAGIVPVCEEILFRGFAIDQLRGAGYGPGGQVIVSAVAFGSFHGFFVIQAALLGVIWAYAFLIGRRSLTPVIIGHSLNNLIGEPWFFLAIVSVQLH